MKRASNVTAYLTLLVFTLSSPTATSRARSDSDKSYSQAREILESAIKAMGGIEALRAISDVTRELVGLRTDQAQGWTPSDPSHVRKKDKSIRDLRRQRSFDQSEATLVGGQPYLVSAVVSPDVIFTANLIDKTVVSSPTSTFAQARAAAFRRYPESLLQTAWSRLEMLRYLGQIEFEGQKQRAIALADSDGAQVSLYFDVTTSLLVRTEILRIYPVVGDAASETVYSDYRRVGNVVLPFSYIDKVSGATLQNLQAVSIVLDTHPPDSHFAMPPGLSQMSPKPLPPTVKKLADNVYALLGAYNSLLAVFKDYALVVEAGFSSAYTQSMIAQIKEIVPDKPIRYLVCTHFHFDHMGGIRSYIAEGTTIVAMPTLKPVIEKAASRPHTLRPDSLARNPRAPLIELFTKKRVFSDETNSVELYDISPNPHAAEMAIIFLPRQKILFEADMLDLDVPEGGIGHAGADTADLADKLRQLGLEVQAIVPAHGRLGAIDDLQQAVAKRAIK